MLVIAGASFAEAREGGSGSDYEYQSDSEYGHGGDGENPPKSG